MYCTHANLNRCCLVTKVYSTTCISWGQVVVQLLFPVHSAGALGKPKDICLFLTIIEY